MSGADRRKYLSAANLTQDLLNWSQDNLDCRLELIVDIEAIDSNGATAAQALIGLMNNSAESVTLTIGDRTYTYQSTSGNLDSLIALVNADDLSPVLLSPTYYSSRALVTAKVPGVSGNSILMTVTGTKLRFCAADQSTFNFTSFTLEDGTGNQTLSPIRISDRNKYIVDLSNTGYFYEARTKIPIISRTVGDWLVPEIQFSTLTLDEISNVDGKFNAYLPGGNDYSPWINKRLTVKLGLGERGSTYFTIFDGRITDVAGFKRSVKSISVTARDIFDTLTSEFPNEVFTKAAFPELEDTYEGRFSPVIYGDWSISVEPDKALIPSFAINGANPYVNGSAANIEDAGYQDLELIVTAMPLTYFDSANIYLKTGDELYLVPQSEVTYLHPNNNRYKIRQNNLTWKNNEKYTYSSGDEFFVRVKGKDLGAYSDNIIAQAQDILVTYGKVDPSIFDANWVTYRDKASPPQSAIATFKSRIYEFEAKTAIQYALSLLEQVRLEAFISKDQKLKINSLHFEDWTPQNYTIKNWDIEQNSFKPSIPERDVFNRARATFDYHPVRSENAQQTKVFRNAASITQIAKAISKQITFPNLYEPDVVINQLKEILKISSSSLENAEFTATWRSVLKDVGDIIRLNISIGSVVYENVPAMIREIGYDPNGLKLPMKVWVLQMCPANASSEIPKGTVGGYAGVITEE